jgi:hypothetical protein
MILIYLVNIRLTIGIKFFGSTFFINFIILNLVREILMSFGISLYRQRTEPLS